MPRETDVFHRRPREPAVGAGSEVHVYTVAPEGGVESAVLETEKVGLRVEAHAAALADRDGRAPGLATICRADHAAVGGGAFLTVNAERSEERRVGKECR